MKRIKQAKLFFTAAICVFTLASFGITSCEDDSEDALYEIVMGDKGNKKGGGSVPGMENITVEFDTQGGLWKGGQRNPELIAFLASAVNPDGTVNLPTKFLQRSGMLFLGWYTEPYKPPVEITKNDNDSGEESEEGGESEEGVEGEESGESEEEPSVAVNAVSGNAPYMLADADTEIDSDKLFTENTKITTSTTLYARWQERGMGTFLVTFIPYFTEGAQGFVRQTVPNEAGEQVLASLPKITVKPEHYDIVGNDHTWWDAPAVNMGKEWTLDMPVTVNNMTLYGNWTPKTYTVTFNLNGGNINGNDVPQERTVTYSKNGPNTVDFDTKDLKYNNYGFLGWFTERRPVVSVAPAAADPLRFIPGETEVIGDVKVWALWQNRPVGSYIVTYKDHNEPDIEPKDLGIEYVKAGETAKFAVGGQSVTRNNYNRVGSNWYYYNGEGEDGGEAIFTATVPVTEDITVYAKWEGAEYNIAFKWWNGKTEGPFPVRYPQTLSEAGVSIPGVGERQNFTAQNVWYSNSEPISEDTRLTGNITVTPLWTATRYEVRFHHNDGTLNITREPAWCTDAMAANPSITLIAEKIPSFTGMRPGYIFNGWFFKKNQADALTEFTKDTVISEDMDVYASWTINSYKVNFHHEDGTGDITSKTARGTELAGVAIVKLAKNEFPPARQKAGYIFDGWFQSDALTEFTEDTVISKDTDVYARWTLNTYKVTFHHVNETGKTESRTGQGTELAGGDTVVKLPAQDIPPAPQRTGYTFAGWYYTNEEGVSTQFTENTVIAGNMNVYAKWTINSYNVSFHHEDGTGGITSKTAWGTELAGGGTVVKLAASEIPPAPQRTGYTFAGWFYPNQAPQQRFTEDTVITGDMDVYARWTINSYNVSFHNNDGPGEKVTNKTAQGMELAGSAVVKLSENEFPPAPQRTGYMFDVWFYTDQTTGSPKQFTKDTVISKDMDVYAYWMGGEAEGQYGSVKNTIANGTVSGTSITYTFKIPDFVKLGTDLVVVKLTPTNTSGKMASLEFQANASANSKSWNVKSPVSQKDYAYAVKVETKIVTAMASGGDITFVSKGDGASRTWDEVHTFNNNGEDEQTHTFKMNRRPATLTGQVLIVAGGGKGGLSRFDSSLGLVLVNVKNYGGGGGAGGVLYTPAVDMPALSGSVTVKVGRGGKNIFNKGRGEKGYNSSYNGVTAIGGGGGGSYKSENIDDVIGADGGSGGGAGGGNYIISSKEYYGKAIQTAPNSNWFANGHNGGGLVVDDDSCKYGGGGGGASGPGRNAANNADGGAGVDYEISGTLYKYSSGGNAGKEGDTVVHDGTAFGDGGSGGSKTALSGNGKEGVVIVRFAFSE
ncbi:MAG: InlB B-repeat-containing protein [Spirochaetaceae bacterium]|jgi:uncharacterized repeat protein (TIGR02543 family)|nr:InlB B-repeat-containing protein [Spirochaetaceae bacterium]